MRIHAVLFTAWLALFITQSRLVATGRIALHRRLGLLGAALASTMIVVGYRAAIDAAQRGFKIDIAHDPLGFLVFPLGDLLSFAVLVALALWYRKRPMAHKRLMLLATCGALMNAPLAHFLAGVPALAAIPPVILIPMVPLLGASAVYDKVTLGKDPSRIAVGRARTVRLREPARRGDRTERGVALAGGVAGRVATFAPPPDDDPP